MSNMQEEIKEILDNLKDDKQMCSYCYYRIFKDDRDKLLDYITNLQEENIKLKELCDKYEEEHNAKFNEWVFDKRENERLTQGVTLLTNELIDMTKEKENYKSKNEKAIEFMKENCDIITLDNGWIIRSELTTTGLGKLFKILKGVDKE